MRLTWPDGFYVTYDHDTVGEMTAIHENGASIFASYAYDDLGRRGARYYSNGTSTLYGYDQISRLNHLTLSGGANATDILPSNDNPAGEIGQRSTSNDAYTFTSSTGTTGYTSNGLNQYSAVGATTPTYDARGNTTNTGSASFTYDLENNLTGNGTVSLYYDALGRLRWDGGPATRFDYDGSNLVAEYDGAGNLLRRYVFGPGIDEPVLWYEGTGTGTKRFLDQNEQGSVVRINDGSGNAIAVNTYDEYGRPGAANQGRFQYTGQAWIADVGLSYYKARMYAPNLGRFMQTDPIGYADGINWYNYVGGNPVNRGDTNGKNCRSLVKLRAYSGCFDPDAAGDVGTYLGGSVLGDNAFLSYAAGVNDAYNAQQAVARRFNQGYVLIGDSDAASSGSAGTPQRQYLDPGKVEDDPIGDIVVTAGLGATARAFQAGYDALEGLIASLSGDSGTLAFSHSYSYDARVFTRALEDPVAHNFPYTFDDQILSTGPLARPNGYSIYQSPGSMNGASGNFEIGVTSDGIINHRFFRPGP